jgi:hypothetical protein
VLGGCSIVLTGIPSPDERIGAMSLVSSTEIKIRGYHVDVYGYVGYARWQVPR